MKLFSLISLATMAIASNARQEPVAVASRLSFGNPTCIAANVKADLTTATPAGTATSLDTYRDEHVFAGERYRGKYFNRNLAFKALKFDKPSRMNLKACGDLCLLDHRVDNNGDPLNTDCTGGAIDPTTNLPLDTVGADLCGSTTATIVPSFRCVTFTFDNRKGKQNCRLYDDSVVPSEYNMKKARKVDTVAMECSMLSEEDSDSIAGWQ